jgi:hypothetical protein
MYAQQTYQQEEGKNIMVDEDGFQQVRHKRNTKRNIFDIVNDELRSSAVALEEEVRTARYRSKQREMEASRRKEGQDGAMTSIGREMQGGAGLDENTMPRQGQTQA